MESSSVPDMYATPGHSMRWTFVTSLHLPVSPCHLWCSRISAGRSPVRRREGM
jgi:hypothetical protein